MFTPGASWPQRHKMILLKWVSDFERFSGLVLMGSAATEIDMCYNLLCNINLISQLTTTSCSQLQVQINSMYGHVRENQLVVKSST